MPYKGPERKKEWERLHRAERLARRRQLRQNEPVTRPLQPNATKVERGNSTLLIPMIAGGALAAYSPSLGLATGSLTPSLPQFLRKGGFGGWWDASFSR